MSRDERFEYAVAELRETVIGDRIDTARLDQLLNQHARQGWRVISITATNVAGRIGPGGVAGLVIVFERRLRVAETPVAETVPTERDEADAWKARRAEIAKAARREREGKTPDGTEGTNGL